MSDKNDGGDKTEKPTPKKLKDARKKGDIARSKEVTSVVLLGAWLLLAVLGLRPVARRLTAIFDANLSYVTSPLPNLAEAGRLSFEAFVIITAIAFVPIMLIGGLTEYLQIGSVFALEKIKPKLSNMNPVEGIKKMFTLDNLIEVLKTLAKALLLVWISWVVIKSMLPDMMRLANSSLGGVQLLFWQVGFKLMGWTLMVFALVAVLDIVYQHHSFTKKMKMSMRDIKQESKDSEGDPYMKQQRKQLMHEWATTNAQAAARQASVLVVNPTHIAIAINYDPESTPVPIVSAKGEDIIALAMREAAEEAGVPILRNIDLARTLHARVPLESIVPMDMFEVIAQVIIWAKQVQEARASGTSDVPTGPGAEPDDPGTGAKPASPPAHAASAGLAQLPPPPHRAK